MDLFFSVHRRFVFPIYIFPSSFWSLSWLLSFVSLLYLSFLALPQQLLCCWCFKGPKHVTALISNMLQSMEAAVSLLYLLCRCIEGWLPPTPPLSWSRCSRKRKSRGAWTVKGYRSPKRRRGNSRINIDEICRERPRSCGLDGLLRRLTPP